MANPKILVIGRDGQLARSLREAGAAKGMVLHAAGRPEIDLQDPGTLRRCVAAHRPSIVVNAAAYTAVDQAEDEPEAAHMANAVAPGVLAEAAEAAGAGIVHVSTDYVFDGSGAAPWREEDATGPRSVYGRTKLAGERAVREASVRHAILRTAWVYSPFGTNFVKTMLRVAEGRDAVRVVGDQFGNPTSALDLAAGILALVERWEQDPGLGAGATYHLAGTGATSWAEFARAIFALSRARGGPFAEVEEITTAEWPAKAPRPLNSRLDSSRFAETFGYRAPPWQESLAVVVDRLLGGEAANG